MRTIHGHEDGLGLSDLIEITCDERDPNSGGASHEYRATIGGKEVLSISFQHGPRAVPTSTPGVTEAVLYAILIDRLAAFQAGPLAHSTNQAQLDHLSAAMVLTCDRAIERRHRGVLGKNKE